jgi:hypothetical protein
VFKLRPKIRSEGLKNKPRQPWTILQVDTGNNAVLASSGMVS